MLEIGQPFPEFKLNNHLGVAVTQEDLKGHWTVVYFYMKDYSDICTRLARDFTVLGRKFKSRNAEIIGVSADSVRTHSIVVGRHRLIQSLLSDPAHALMIASGVWGVKKVHGKEVMGCHRTTFVLDPEGVVREVFPNVITVNHPSNVLDALVALQKTDQ
jgi:peroxiredoxin Q/BCP